MVKEYEVTYIDGIKEIIKVVAMAQLRHLIEHRKVRGYKRVR